MKRLLLLLLATGLVVLPVSRAHAHTYLVASQPPAGASVKQAPARVVLTFNERVETNFGGVRVVGPDGARMERGEAQVDGRDVTVRMQQLSEPGRYRVVYRIISADGHPVESRFTFDFDPPPARSPEPQPDAEAPATAEDANGDQPTEAAAAGSRAAPTEAEDMAAAPADESMGDLADEGAMADEGYLREGGMPMGSSVGLWLARLTNYLATAAVIGLLVVASLLLPSAGRLTATARRTSKVAAGVAVVWALSALALLAFGASSVAARPLAQTLQPDVLADFVTTRFGATVLLQVPVVLAVGAVAAAARSREVAGGALILACLAAFAPVWWGHAGTLEDNSAIALASDWAHMLGAAGWVGGLAALAFVVARSGEEMELGTPVKRFSRMAGIALFVVLASGVVNSILHMGAVDQLWTTSWGRLVIVKVLLFAVIILLGGIQRYRYVPRIANSDSPVQARKGFRRVAAAEVGLMVLAFGVATGLASIMPAEAEVAARRQSVVTAIGDGQVNLTVDPATTGTNRIEINFLDASGEYREVRDPTVTFSRNGQDRTAEPEQSGPGRYLLEQQRFSEPGEWELTVRAATTEGPQQASATVMIR